MSTTAQQSDQQQPSGQVQGDQYVAPRSQKSRLKEPRNVGNKDKTQQASSQPQGDQQVRHRHHRVSTPIKVAIIFAAAGIIGAIISGVFLLLANNNKNGPTPTPTPIISPTPPLPPNITFTSLVEGSEVGYGPVTVQGTASHIPQGEYLWILVQPVDTSLYFPQVGPVAIAKDDTWELGAYIGKEGSADVGKKFQLWAVLADQGANTALKTYRTANEEKQKVHPGADFDPFVPQPGGIQMIVYITVARK